MRNRNSPVMNSTNHHWQYGTSAGGNSSTHHNQVWIFFSLNRLFSKISFKHEEFSPFKISTPKSYIHQ